MTKALPPQLSECFRDITIRIFCDRVQEFGILEADQLCDKNPTTTIDRQTEL